ncbi:sulfur carrier protein ThiS [Candidatus Sodalis pierantonius str. SOPE]|uniref:Sulfur carrier protein ThiS n=1 Tax=Candidatus Sodalis pierantonii str. SOPE TaxID=2342 RepID=W0HQK0_9GAMM|nr:sulfur carrier protein ThiS [Candidatus Sodalis pierantonius]AHF74802.1 sulfur carrier protein ThiS [Candidatus Sodalis pierantonius str. SOPE]
MKITLNDRPLTLTQPVTLDALLTEHHHPGPGIALAVNKTIIPRRQCTQYRVQDGDDILLFQAIAGG